MTFNKQKPQLDPFGSKISLLFVVGVVEDEVIVVVVRVWAIVDEVSIEAVVGSRSGIVVRAVIVGDEVSFEAIVGSIALRSSIVIVVVSIASISIIVESVTVFRS